MINIYYVIMKIKFTLLFVLFLNLVFSQVGIGTTNPSASLDVFQQIPTGNPPQGVLVPRMTGNELKTMTVGINQHSMLVYATSAATSSSLTVAEFVDAEGYYYYDNKINRFVKLCDTSSLSATAMLKGCYMPGDYANQTKNNFDLFLGTINSDKTYFVLSETNTSNPQAVTITGITGGIDGRIITIVSHQQNFQIKLEDSNANSAVGNRINTSTFTGSGALQINNKGYVTLMYQISDKKWHVIDYRIGQP